MRLPPRIEEVAVVVSAADGTSLEGLQYTPEGPVQRGRAVVCHPHPLHGGTMQNKVVTSAARAAASAGYATLRFNFRGVGSSGGVYGAGVGEVADVRGALVHMDRVSGGEGVRALIGFSFGSMVSVSALRDGLEVDVAVLIGLPLDGWEIAPVSMIPMGGLHVIVGEHDEFCSVDGARAWVAAHDDPGVVLTVVEGTDHFFGGRLGVLSRAVYEALGGEPGGAERW